MRISDWSSDVCSSDLAAGSYAASNHTHTTLTITGSSWNDNFSIEGNSPSIYFKDTGSAAAYVGINSATFYVLRDEDANGSFESPYPFSSRSEEHTSELQSLMRISYAVFCLKKKSIQSYYYPQLSKYYYHTHID